MSKAHCQRCSLGRSGKHLVQEVGDLWWEFRRSHNWHLKRYFVVNIVTAGNAAKFRISLAIFNDGTQGDMISLAREVPRELSRSHHPFWIWIWMMSPRGGTYELLKLRALKLSTLYKNFKGSLRNSTQNILPIHWKMCTFYLDYNI